jgi:hypothetical protein
VIDPDRRAKYPRAGDPVDVADFARVCWWTGTQGNDLCVHEIQPGADGLMPPARDPQTGEWHIGLEWPDPRDVQRVVVRYATQDGVPPGLRVQYWRQNWPTPAPERRAGARRGWIGRDDPWHGQWTTVRAEKVVEGCTCTWTFDPIDLPELGGRRAIAQFNESEHYLARFRRTLKLRLVSEGEEQPLVSGIHVYSTARWQEGAIEVRYDPEGALSGWTGRAEAANGYILGVEPLDTSGSRFGRTETGAAENARRGMHLSILYAVSDRSSDCGRTVITVRGPARGFSFLVADLDRGPVYIRDAEVCITWAEKGVPVESLRAQLEAAPRPIYDRVPDEPEHSLERAMAEIPPLDVTKQEPFGRYLPLGVEAGRQEYALRYNGELFADKAALKLAGRDAVRLLWPGHQIRFRFGTGDPPDFREGRDGTEQSIFDGWLPVVTSRWVDREIEYEQTAFVTLLNGEMTPPDERRGDEEVVAMLRIAFRNTTPGGKRAYLWLAIAPQERIELRDGLIVALGRVVPAGSVARQWRVEPYEADVLRCAVKTGERGNLAVVPYAGEEGASQAVPTAALFDIELDEGETQTIHLALPFAGLTDRAEWQRVAHLEYGAKLADVAAYWRGYVERGGQMEVPDRLLADFHKAARVHVGISVDKDPVSGLTVVPAATWSYGACGNEACWQITMLDQAGHHDRAEAYLETFLRTQGMVKPDGRFASAVGALQGVDLDGGVPVMSGFGYNLDHGYIMECLAHHYRFTGDRAWLARVAPHLVAACDFCIRERQSTKVYRPSSRTGGGREPVSEWGLLPPGHLEDNREWRHWFAVNAHAHRGMQAISTVLAEVGHPQARRLVEETVAYREDIRRAVRRAMVESPVVRLRDGTYVPHVPTRTAVRGREWGWFREAAYGALHLQDGNVFDPHEDEMTWALKDLEDNLFVSREWGRPVDVERHWFSHGGVTIQPNLMDLGIAYLRRGQVKHALRALYNNYAASLYPDVRVFAEHPVVELGHGVGPFYKTPDECKALVWLRAFLLREEGDSLHLAMGAPRAWFAPGQSFGVRGMASFFGPVTYRVQSGPSEITVRCALDEGRAPREVVAHLRRPGCQAIRRVTVDGAAHADLGAGGKVVRVTGLSGEVTIRAEYL